MKRRSRYLVGGIVGGIAVAALATLVYDRSSVIDWVGSHDLSIEFVVSDADTGAAIGNAEIDAHDPEAPREPRVKSTTDEDGIARWQGERTCAGQTSRLRLTNCYIVDIPSWEITVRAPQYQESEPIQLWKLSRKTIPTGPRSDSMRVLITLIRAAK